MIYYHMEVGPGTFLYCTWLPVLLMFQTVVRLLTLAALTLALALSASAVVMFTSPTPRARQLTWPSRSRGDLREGRTTGRRGLRPRLLPGCSCPVPRRRSRVHLTNAARTSFDVPVSFAR